METFKRLTIKIDNKMKTVGWICLEKKLFVKEVDEKSHLYRAKDSGNLNGKIFKELDDINGILIYDYSNHILYYTNADNFMLPKPRYITNVKDKELQIYLPRNCFNKLLNIDNDKLGQSIDKINFNERKIKTNNSETRNSKRQSSLLELVGK